MTLRLEVRKAAAMRRTDDGVFSPATLDPAEVRRPPPGPTPDWTAEGVISVLGGMALPERIVRMERVLGGRTQAVTVVLDDPYDPHNVSAVLRTCDAFGIQDVHILRAKAQLLATSKITKGSHQWIDTFQHKDAALGIRDLKAAGYQVVVTHPEGDLLPNDLREVSRLALVFGNEHEGVSEEVSREAHATVRIAMCGFVESLNLSVSAAILLHAATEGRERGLAPETRMNLLARWLRHSVPRSAEILASFDAR